MNEIAIEKSYQKAIKYSEINFEDIKEMILQYPMRQFRPKNIAQFALRNMNIVIDRDIDDYRSLVRKITLVCQRMVANGELRVVGIYSRRPIYDKRIQ